MTGYEERVLVVAPTGRDSELICQLLRDGGDDCLTFRDVAGALNAAESGLAALLLADEALTEGAIRAIQHFRQSQPSWSDPPILLLTRKGEQKDDAHPILNGLGQVSVIERPVGRRPLLTAVQAALRARKRQYEVRAQMAELTRIGEELRIANSKKDELLGLVSHELRTPLTGIIGFSDLLLRRSQELPEEEREILLRDIHDHGKRLQRVIENMLVLSRAETLKDADTEPLLLQRFLPKVLDGLAPLTGGRQTSVNLAPDLPPVSANAVFVELVVTNLVRNSEKYAYQDTVIDVGLEQRGDSVAVTVADRGAELDQPHVDQMFEIFYRDPEQSKNVYGLGLGLPVCKRLTEIQGGSIAAHPRVGGGLEVTVSLPTIGD